MITWFLGNPCALRNASSVGLVRNLLLIFPFSSQIRTQNALQPMYDGYQLSWKECTMHNADHPK
jgi:hypothetical protein